MRPADRLFQIVQLIRGRRLTTARWLAERLGLSERTIYRDIAQLQAQGVPIEGEAGVGYRLGRGFDLPPLMFTLEEARALASAVQLAQQWLDPELAAASEAALSRVLSVLATDVRERTRVLHLVVAPSGLGDSVRSSMQLLRRASQTRNKVRVEYRDATEIRSERVVRPLALFYWGKVWTLTAWCEARNNFRNFRLDRIETLTRLDERFELESGKTLDDFLALEECAANSS
ncbi:MAG: YafY family transcriptional regulator [Cytophagales bacterium]|nr:YafY family transcriptional regulator [Rhizobacter sp.]